MRTRVVVNPAAGGGRSAARARSLRPRLEAALGPLEWCESRSAAHVTDLVAEAASRGDARVIVAGGDGTAHFAANGLAGTETALGILPVGTGNDIAWSVGMPREPEAAVATLAAGHVRRFDLGRVASRLYCCVLGVGMDTRALERINAARVLPRGHLLYTWAALETVLTYRPETVTISWDDGRWRGELMFGAVTNTKSYAGGMRITPLADTADGRLDLCILPRMALPRMLAIFGSVLGGRHVGAKGVVMAKSAHVKIESERPLPITLDGELTDLTTPIDVTVLPGALRLIGTPLAHGGTTDRGAQVLSVGGADHE